VWVSVGNLPDVSEPSLSSTTIYQLRVVLCGVSPLVWRRLLVASDISIAANSTKFFRVPSIWVTGDVLWFAT
jgi:hypothetical protein